MKWLRIFGKFLISVGVGILLFVVWTLWGTNLVTRQAQARLETEFNDLPVFTQTDPEDPAGPPPSFRPGPGDPVFRLRIPAIDLSNIVVEGVGVEDLKQGPGHYPKCRPGFEPPLCTEFPEVWPGEDGRVVVSGHRTTYGAPFWSLDELRPGDEIITETKWGRFVYRVTEKAIVPPDSRAIVIPSDEPELVLTTCNPRYSAAERLIVFAELEEGP